MSFMLYSILYIPRKRCGKHAKALGCGLRRKTGESRRFVDCGNAKLGGGMVALGLGSEIQLWELANVFVWVIKLHFYIYQFTQINIDIAGEIKYYFHDSVLNTQGKDG